jgi:hypothetical protein
VSVGHVARAIEEAGIPTVVIGSRVFKSRMVGMRLPRLVLTPEIMGRTLGEPGATDAQRKYLELGLDLLENAKEPGKLIEA